jgi:hypothetical protein
VELGGRHPGGKDRENLAEVDVHQVGPRSQDRGQDGCLQAVELAEAPNGKSQTYHAGVVAEVLEVQRGGRARGNNLLDDARRSSARVSSTVWFCIPLMGSKLAPFPAWPRRAVRTPSRALTSSLESHLHISERP